VETFGIFWTKSAENDLKNIIEYIKRDSAERAKEIFYAIKDECESLKNLPERKRVVPELQQFGIVHYREIIYKRWRIIFKIEEKSVYVLVVVDSSRDLEDLLFERLMEK